MPYISALSGRGCGPRSGPRNGTLRGNSLEAEQAETEVRSATWGGSGMDGWRMVSTQWPGADGEVCSRRGPKIHSLCALPVLPEADPEGQRSLELGPCSRFFHKRLFTVEWTVDLSSCPVRGESHSESSDSCLHKKHAKPSAPKRGDSYESQLDCPPWPEAAGRS